MRRFVREFLSSAKIARTRVIPALLRSNNAEYFRNSERNGNPKLVAASFSIQNYYDTYNELLQDTKFEKINIFSNLFT